MPYPGVLLGFLLGAGVAVVVMAYFLNHMDPEPRHRNYHNARSPPDEPGWHQGGNTRHGPTSNVPRQSPRLRKRKQSAQKEVFSCVICCEELVHDIRTLPCQHKFHRCCVNEWFKKHQTCPLCRKTATM